VTLLRVLFLALLQAYMGYAAAESIDDGLTSIAREIVVSDSVHGEFRQEKTLPFVTTPFVSTGEFRLARESGLFWHVLEPLESTMLVRDGQVSLDGKRVDDQGVGRLITTVMLGFLEGNLSGLKETFDVSTDILDAGWTMSLTPKSSRLRAAIELVRIQGKQHLTAIEIVDAEHNRTLMQFTNVRTDAQEAVPLAEPAR
tara:strand:- start:13493 stop:14089 length:597 start_codon:yes stop_codon:yes gene_type:complete